MRKNFSAIAGYSAKTVSPRLDAAVSSFSGRQQLYERYSSGDPVHLAGTLHGLYDKDAHIDRIVAMLDELEARHPPPVAGEG